MSHSKASKIYCKSGTIKDIYLKFFKLHKLWYLLMTNKNFSQVATFIWSVADLLDGDFKKSKYGRVILPFTLLRRLKKTIHCIDLNKTH